MTYNILHMFRCSMDLSKPICTVKLCQGPCKLLTFNGAIFILGCRWLELIYLLLSKHNESRFSSKWWGFNSGPDRWGHYHFRAYISERKRQRANSQINQVITSSSDKSMKRYNWWCWWGCVLSRDGKISTRKWHLSWDLGWEIPIESWGTGRPDSRNSKCGYR